MKRNAPEMKGTKHYREEKTPKQITYMTKLYDENGIAVCQKLRYAAMKETGLKWIQIYKWIYDLHTQKENLKNIMNGQPAKIFYIRRNYAS